MKPLKEKTCKIGGEKFVPIRPFQPTCFEHAGEYLAQQQAKKWRKEGKEMKDKIKTHSNWLQELQVIFNKWVVLRDKSLPCISCGTTNNVMYSSGHYYTVGSYPNLRFHPDNAHKQCLNDCNRNKHGNISEYTPNLIKKIGVMKFRELESLRNKPLKLSIPEIIDLKTHYRKLIKSLNH